MVDNSSKCIFVLISMLGQVILLAIGVGCVAARSRYVFKIQSVHRAELPGVGNLLKVELNQNGVPAKLSANGNTSTGVCTYFSIKRKYRRGVTIAWACRKNGTSYGLAVDKGGQLVIKRMPQSISQEFAFRFVRARQRNYQFRPVNFQNNCLIAHRGGNVTAARCPIDPKKRSAMFKVKQLRSRSKPKCP